MTTGGHDDESGVARGEPSVDPAGALLAVASSSVPRWLRRVVLAAAERGGLDLDVHGAELEAAADASASVCVDQLRALLATDVDEQRTNPLSLIRSSVEAPSHRLLELGARQPSIDAFHRDRFPGDPFGLGPSSWNEVDDELHGAGITWGAWKAMTVLRRRREEGQLDR